MGAVVDKLWPMSDMTVTRWWSRSFPTIWLLSVAGTTFTPTGDLLSHIPTQAGIVVLVNPRGEQEGQLREQAARTVLKAAGLADALKAVEGLPGLDEALLARRYAVARIEGDGPPALLGVVAADNESLLQAGVGSGAVASNPGAVALRLDSAGRARALFLMPGGRLLFGDRAAVELASSLVKRSGKSGFDPSLFLDRFGSSPEGVPEIVRGYLKPAALGVKPSTDASMPDWTLTSALSRLRGAAFVVQGGAFPAFRLQLALEGEPAASLVAEEIELALKSMNAPSPQVERMLSAGRVRRFGADVEWSMPIDTGLLKALEETRAAADFLRLGFLPRDREARERIPELFQAMGAQEGARVADIGAGQGFLTRRLARAVGSAGEVWAVDVSAGALKALQEGVAARYGNVKVVEGAVDDPRLPPGRLDGAAIVNAYHEMEEYASMLQHIHRSLVPGGRLVLLEPYSPEKMESSRAEQAEAHQIAPRLVEADLRAAGFRIVRVDPEFVSQRHEDHQHFEALFVAERR